jgi:hypothetical protein
VLLEKRRLVRAHGDSAVLWSNDPLGSIGRPMGQLPTDGWHFCLALGPFDTQQDAMNYGQELFSHTRGAATRREKARRLSVSRGYGLHEEPPPVILDGPLKYGLCTRQRGP